MDTAEYSLQNQISGLRVPPAVSVVGTGGVGAWIALFASIAGVRRLILFDPGVVDGKDLSRSPFKQQHLGMPKVTALQSLILELRPDAKVETYARGYEPEDESRLEGAVFHSASNNRVCIRKVRNDQMGTPSGSLPAEPQAAAALGASENGLYVA